MQAYVQTRGRELPGNNNWALLAELFHEQARRWPSLAEAHVQSVLKTTLQWIDQAVKRVTSAEKLQTEVDTILKDWVDKAEHSALSELQKLIEDEQNGPLTYNHYYTDNVQKSRLDNQKAALKTAVNSGVVGGPVDNSYLAMFESHITFDMQERACKEAFNDLEAYYKVRNTVVSQKIEANCGLIGRPQNLRGQCRAPGN